MLRLSLATICASALWLMTTGPLDALLTSAKAAGMAEVGVSYPQDAMAGAFNPAGAVDVPDRIDVSGFWVHDKGRVKVHGNLAPVPDVNGTFKPYLTKDSYLGDFGINRRFCHCGVQMAASLVVYNRNALKTTYTQKFPLLGTTKLGSEYIHETISPLLALRYGDFCLGISLNAMVTRMKAEGLQSFDSALYSTSPGNVTNRGYSYSTGCSFTVGAKWDITPWLTIAATVQPKTTMSRFKRYKGFIAEHGRLSIPPVYSGGVTLRLASCASVSLDVQHLGWNRVRALHNPLEPNLQTHLLGSKNGAAFGWRSQTIFRLGADWQVIPCLTLRGGYRWCQQFIPRNQTAVNLLTNEVAVRFYAFGCSWSPMDRCELSAFFARSLSNKRRGRGSIPASFGGGEVDLSQDKTIAGLGLGWLY